MANGQKIRIYHPFSFATVLSPSIFFFFQWKTSKNESAAIIKQKTDHMLYLPPTPTSQILIVHHINHFWQNRNPFDMSLFWENYITSRNPRIILWLRQLRGAHCIFRLHSWQCHRFWVTRGKSPLLVFSFPKIDINLIIPSASII